MVHCIMDNEEMVNIFIDEEEDVIYGSLSINEEFNEISGDEVDDN